MHGFDISPRAALAAPTEPSIIRIQSAAILGTSIVSVLGAAWMIASFFAFSNLRSFRHQLILGLAISDCAMAFNFLLSSSMNLGGRWIGAPEQARFCSFNGYMAQVFVIQTDYWVLTIAVYTYFVLTDQKKWSSWVLAHPVFPWALPWVFSVLWASIGLWLAGYGDIGAWCWFTSDQVRLLVNFVPRWAIIVIMFLMYARLYLILFRAHRRLASLDGSNSGNPTGSGSRHIEGNSGSHNRRLKRFARLMLLYPLAYAVVWSLPTAIRIYQTVSSRPAPWQLATVDKACIVMQGFIDAIIYGATESSLSSWRTALFPGSRKRPSGPMARKLPGLSDHNSSWKRRSRNWDSGSAASAGQQELVSQSSLTGPDMLGTPSHSHSAEPLEMTTTRATSRSSTQKSQLERPKLSIRKTVEIRVLNSAASNGKAAALQKPEKTHFPDSRHESFLLDK